MIILSAQPMLLHVVTNPAANSAERVEYTDSEN